jgi:hypothetical protein
MRRLNGFEPVCRLDAKMYHTGVYTGKIPCLRSKAGPPLREEVVVVRYHGGSPMRCRSTLLLVVYMPYGQL